MKCPKCKADLTEDFVTVYKLGRNDAEIALQKTINCLTKTHRALFKELTRLDRIFPLTDAPDVIMLKVDQAHYIILALRRNASESQRKYAASMLLKALKAQAGHFPELAKELKRMHKERDPGDGT